MTLLEQLKRTHELCTQQLTPEAIGNFTDGEIQALYEAIQSLQQFRTPLAVVAGLREFDLSDEEEQREFDEAMALLTTD
jgi:hypothetical protein